MSRLEPLLAKFDAGLCIRNKRQDVQGAGIIHVDEYVKSAVPPPVVPVNFTMIN